MALSDTSICNRALQKLGAKRITSLTQDSPEARDCNAVYEDIRDRELSRHNWKFAIKRATLAPSATEPEFEFDYAFPYLSDMLRVIKRVNPPCDWVIENIAGAPAILTNEGNSLEVRYISRITDPTMFDPCFAEMLACALADQLSEKITQSNTKKADIRDEYKMWRREATKKNAFEQLPGEMPEDTWVTCRL